MEKNKEKAFHGWRAGRFHLNFPNGNQISTVWGSGTYSDNHDDSQDSDFLLGRQKNSPVFDSSTVEIMFTAPDKLTKKILKKYSDGSGQPIGYLPQDKWLEIVNLLAAHINKDK